MINGGIMKEYIYVGMCMTKRGLTVISVKLVNHANDQDAVGGVLSYLESSSADIQSVLVFDALEDQQICEVLV